MLGHEASRSNFESGSNGRQGKSGAALKELGVSDLAGGKTNKPKNKTTNRGEFLYDFFKNFNSSHALSVVLRERKKKKNFFFSSAG